MRWSGLVEGCTGRTLPHAISSAAATSHSASPSPAAAKMRAVLQCKLACLSLDGQAQVEAQGAMDQEKRHDARPKVGMLHHVLGHERTWRCQRLQGLAT